MHLRKLCAGLLLLVLPACGPGLITPEIATSERFIAVGDGGTILFTPSDDPSTWNPAPPAVSDHLQAIAYGNGVLVAVGDFGTVTYSENHGETWQSGTISANEKLTAIHFANGMFVTAGSDSFASFGIYVSMDGRTWTLKDSTAFSPTGQTVAGIGFGLGVWSILDSSGNSSTSPDGSTWSSAISSGSGSVSSMIFNPVQGEFLAGDPAGLMYESTDGLTFTGALDPATGSALVDFAIGNGDVLMLSNTGEVFRSTAGSAGPWDLAGNTGAVAHAIALTAGYEVVVGDAGAVYYRTPGASSHTTVQTAASSSLRDVIAIQY